MAASPFLKYLRHGLHKKLVLWIKIYSCPIIVYFFIMETTSMWKMCRKLSESLDSSVPTLSYPSKTFLLLETAFYVV